MPRHAHRTEPLFARPADGPARVEYVRAGLGEYLTCRGCGAVWRYTAHGGRHLRRVGGGAAKLRRRAAVWNERWGEGLNEGSDGDGKDISD